MGGDYLALAGLSKAVDREMGRRDTLDNLCAWQIGLFAAFKLLQTAAQPCQLCLLSGQFLGVPTIALR